MLEDDEQIETSDSSSSGASSSSDVNHDIFSVHKLSLVATWSWNPTDNDTCAICRQHIMECCIECESKKNKPDEEIKDCRVVRGACRHAFHDHCIVRWLQSRKTCPLDNVTWEYQKYGQDSTK